LNWLSSEERRLLTGVQLEIARGESAQARLQLSEEQKEKLGSAQKDSKIAELS
jgi:hypothetical protein